MEKSDPDKTRGPARKVETRDVLQFFKTRPNLFEPMTAPDVAQHLDVSRPTARKRLDELVEEGKLKTKQVGARGRVYWLTEPTAAQSLAPAPVQREDDVDNLRIDNPNRELIAAEANLHSHDGFELRPTEGDPIDALALPGDEVEMERHQAVVRVVHDYLLQYERATEKALQAVAWRVESDTYESGHELWQRVIEPALTELPTVDREVRKGTTVWFYIPPDEVSESANQ